MKYIGSIFSIALLTLVVGCATAPTKENTLAAAGFRLISPNSPAQQQKLNSLPTGKITPVTSAGKVFYVYPELKTNQAYVGGPKQYNAYQVLRSNQKLARENLMNARENQLGSMDWGDSSLAGACGNASGWY